MDFSKSYKIGEGGTWVSVNPPTPAKPIPLRPRAIPIDQLGNTDWLRSMGIPAHYLQGNPGSPLIANGEVSQLNSMGAPAESFQESSSISNGGISHLNSINLVNQHAQVNTWESMAARDRASNHITAALQQQQPVLRLNSIDLAYQLGELHSLDAGPSGRNRTSGYITAGPQPQNLPASNGGLSRSNSINLTAQQRQLNSWDASMIGRDTTASRPRNPPASNGGVTRLHSVNYTDQQQENSWDAALIASDRGSGPITTAGSRRQVMSNGATGWNNIPFSHLLALADAASETSTHGHQGGSYSSAARNFFPLSSAPIENHHQQSNSVTMLLKNQSAMLQNQNNTICSNQRRNSNAPPQMSQYGFPVPYHATYEPRTIADAASNGSISFQFDPITPNKGRNENSNQPPEMSSNFLDERLHQERNMLQDGVDHLREKTVDLHCQEAQLQSEVHSSPLAPELLSQSAKDTTCAPLSVTLEENHNHEKGEGNGFDLNKTPQQKPKRKKIRPRVVREGKPKRTPKSTEKQGIPKENQPAKRKYVRKNGTKAQHTQQINAGEEIPNTSTASKSCKRALHFNLEGQEERTTVGHLEGEIQSNLDSIPGTVTFNTISESQSQQLHSRNNDTSGNTSTIHIGHGFEVVVDNSPGGIAFDLNQSLNQILEEYISLPDMENPHTPPVRSDPLKERDGMGIASDNNNNRNTVSEAASNSIFQAESVQTSDNAVISSQSNHSVPRSWENSNCNHYQPLAEGERQMVPKRTLSHIHEAPVLDLIREHIDSVPIYNNILPRNDEYMQSSNGGSLFPESSKKRRIGKIQKTVLSPSKAIAGDGSTQKDTTTEPSTPQKGYNRCWNSQFPNASSAENLRNGASNAVHGHHSQSPTTGQMHQTNVPSDTLSCQEMSSGVMTNIVQNSEFMVTPGQTERIPKKRSKGATRVRDFASLTAVSGCSSLTSAQWTLLSGSKQQAEICHRPQLYLEATPHDKRARGEKYKFNDERLSISTSKSHSSKNEVWLQENQAMVCSYLHSSAKQRGRPKGSSNLNSPPKQRGSREIVHSINSVLDEIIWKLSNLNINSVSNTVLGSEQNALVPYMGENQMVLFDSTKKRKPRAKVDLDPETDRVWKLLMGKESGIDDEGTDAEKQRWWEEERRIFRGRADSFIARMHLIQGDRRFSKWTGSVVDSVVGVFLTQNVSDHLSSSAFMSLAAHFPIKSTRNSRAGDEAYMYVEEPEMSIVENREIGNSNESFGSNAGGGSVIEVTKCTELFACESTPDMFHESSKNRAEIQSLGAECPGIIEEDDKRSLEVQSSIVSSQDSADSSIQMTTARTTKVGTGLSEGEERGALDDFVSSQNSGNSSVAHTDELLKSCSDSNSEEDLPTGSKFNSFNTTYTKLLQMAGTPMFQEYYNHGSLSLSSDLHSEIICKQSEAKKSDERELTLNKMNAKGDSFTISSLTEPHPTQTTINPSCKFSLCVTPNSGILEVECPEIIAADTFSLPPAADSTEITEVDNASQRNGTVADIFSTIAGQQKTAHLLSNSLGERNEAVKSQGSPPTDPKTHDRVLMERRNNGIEQANSSSSNPFGETLDVAESVVLVNQQNPKENTVAESNMKGQVYSSDRVSNDTATKAGNAKPKPEKEKRKEFDWDSLRKEAYQRCGKREWSHDTMDSLDWEAVRSADVSEIAKTIKERGMNNMLAERIKDFLNRLVREHESIDLEWLRDVPPDKAKEYLLSVRGLGLKSVECVRLLTLHHLAFPVDTNVGRIAVRLGWVPLQPLPESLQLHLLELYPIQESIQKYLWPRLCTLDQPTLYELHYQLITFGKVFCTKSKPNCNACPMRAECKHFASAFASARLTLPGPEEKGIVSSTTPVVDSQSSTVHPNPMSLPPPETSTNQSSDVHLNPMSLPPPDTSTSETRSEIGHCQSIVNVPVSPNMLSETRSKISDTQPIIEVPASPEPECTEIQESDIEDAFYEDPDEIPTIELNIKDFATNLQNYMQQNNLELQEVDMSKALVALTPEAASIPTPKLKNVSRLRTEHQVYELPDSHPLLVGVEKRVPGEVCSYLLAIWTPGETAESTQPPQRCCGSQTSDNLCNEKTCFSCNSIREANSQTVRGTLLIPCKTAMRGSFPLNGTYFQVNEVFADHDSSLNPIDVPRNWLWNLPRRTVFFGTSVPSIFKGLRTEEIQSCFWRGYVCVRGFDQKTRAPRPLMARLHFPASRLISALRQKQEELKGRQQK